ncbi:xyloglucan endotransglucosylase/hydrolase-like [Camellia sinensis]|uniref:xyloglucan endotransglucosylase/hydrolase-like n=1 Tax=Camellia sinensis TaxID=4442 RepID=UPI0010367A99|nr:xyloglucan endotransglucosylase/hydrolase-like [Camellia sinensis]
MMFVHQPGSGIKSKLNYTFGFFHMNIKLPANDSGGVATAFYLKSEDSELDFEFLGNKKGKPIRVQTNSKGYKEVKSIGASVDQSIDVAGIYNEAATLNQEDMVIDESNSGEPWVQGFMEGEYSDLNV